MEKARRAEITIAGHKVEVFQLPNGEYVMSQTQASEVVGKHRNQVLRFLDSIDPEALPSQSFKCYTVATTDTKTPIQAIPLDVVSHYWLEQSFKGNKYAQALTKACMQETLERRADAAFNAIKAEAQYEARTAWNYDQWVKSRTFSKCSHDAFQRACYDFGFRPSDVHDELTKLVTGMTANQHRQLELVGNDPTIGLDYVKDAHQLAVLAQAKLNFGLQRKGTLRERCERAVGGARALLNALGVA